MIIKKYDSNDNFIYFCQECSIEWIPKGTSTNTKLKTVAIKHWDKFHKPVN